MIYKILDFQTKQQVCYSKSIRKLILKENHNNKVLQN